MTKRGRGMVFAVDLVALCIFFLFLSRGGVVVVHHPYYCLGTDETVILVFFLCLFVCLFVCTIGHVGSCCLCVLFHFISSVCAIFGLLCHTGAHGQWIRQSKPAQQNSTEIRLLPLASESSFSVAPIRVNKVHTPP